MTTPLQKFYYGLLGIGGGLLTNNVTKTAAYVCDSGSVPDTVVFTNLAAAAAITLPASTAGRTIKVKDIGGTAAAKNVTITPASGTIDGAATYVLTLNHAGVELTCDGTNWWVTSSYNGTVI